MNILGSLTNGVRVGGPVGMSFLFLVAAGLTGCATEGGSNEGARRGAIGGAALGLTLGVLTGEPELAAAGAIAGGVTGAAAGTMRDYEEDRKDARAETIAGGMAGRNAGQPATTAQPATWEDIDKFPGRWRVDIWSYEPEGERVTAQATATGILTSTRSATIKLDDISSNGQSVGITGNSVFTFDAAQQSFGLVNNYSTMPRPQTYVGEYQSGVQRYYFYYTGSDLETRTGVSRSDYRLEMRFVGRDVIIIETQIESGGRFVPIQSYRFTRMQ